MITPKDCVLIVGVSLFSFGVLCLPVGIGVSPKRDLSVFFNLADMGAFVSTGLTLIVVGLFIVMLGWFFSAVASKIRRLLRRSSERRYSRH